MWERLHGRDRMTVRGFRLVEAFGCRQILDREVHSLKKGAQARY
jgi:hypothetical protein